MLFTSSPAKTGFTEGNSKPIGYPACFDPLYVKDFPFHCQIQDKRATAHPSVINLLTNEAVNGAKVVIDGKLITCRGLATVTYFALAIVGKLFGYGRARSVAEGLVFEYPRS